MRVLGAVVALLLVAVAAARGSPQPSADRRRRRRRRRRPMPAILQNYKPVTAERLKKPEDGDWLMIRRTYDGWGYSPLDSDHAGQRARGCSRCGCSRPA